MINGTLTRAAAVTGIAAVFVFGIGCAAIAGPIGIALYDPDPQPVNGTVATSAMSQRAPGGTTPVDNLTGRGYPDTSAYYGTGHGVIPPGPMRGTYGAGGRIYFHAEQPGRIEAFYGVDGKIYFRRVATSAYRSPAHLPY